MSHIAIIGGGAAGLMCTATLIQSHTQNQLTVYDKNRQLGSKVIISGGGRCNVTTAYYRRQDLQKAYIRGRDLISHAISKFGPRQIYKWFEDQGVELKVESDQRVFPVSDHGRDIVGVFEKMIASTAHVEHIPIAVTSLDPKGGCFVLKCSDGSYHYADQVVISTGGNAYSHTGSTGDGYTFARQCGHHMTPLGPSLNSFHIAEMVFGDCSGISLQDVRYHFSIGGLHKVVDGAMIFTHFGISGPATFVLSAHLAFELIDQRHPYQIRLQCFAHRDHQWRMKALIQASQDHPRQQIKTFLSGLMPDRLAHALLDSAGVPTTSILTHITRSQRSHLADILGNGLYLTLIARRAGDEFVTAGGILASEIDPLTMQSLVCPNLYLAGEVMDVDGVTGGYNLTASWATGRLAGLSIARLG